MDAESRVERAGAALDVIHTATDVVSGSHDQIAAAQFDKPRCIRRAFRHPGIGRHHCVHVADIVPGNHRHISAAECAHALEEIAEVHPPSRRGGFTEIGYAKFASHRIYVAATIKPRRRQLTLRIGHYRAGCVACVMRDVALRGDHHVTAAERVLHSVGSAILNGTQRADRRAEPSRSRCVKRAA